MYIKGRLCINWDADDLFGSPPLGPTDRNNYTDRNYYRYYVPHQYLDEEFCNDELHPVSAGPAIKAVLQRQQDARDDKYSKYTEVLWSAPTRAASKAKIEAFAQWARSRGFETVSDFF